MVIVYCIAILPVSLYKSFQAQAFSLPRPSHLYVRPYNIFLALSILQLHTVRKHKKHNQVDKKKLVNGIIVGIAN